MTTKKITTFFIDKKLHERFKVYCVREKKSMSKVLGDLIKTLLNIK